MQNSNLHKLGKNELLSIIYEQQKEIENLKIEKKDLEKKLEDKIIDLKEAGSIAEASLKINKVFEMAQEAANQYLDSIKAINRTEKVQVENQITVNEKKKKTQKDEIKHEKLKNLVEVTSLVPVNNSLVLYKHNFFEKLKVKIKFIKNFLNKFLKFSKGIIILILKKVSVFFSNFFKKRKLVKKTVIEEDNNIVVTVEEIEKEINQIKKKKRKKIFIKSFLYSSTVVVAIAIITATMFFKVLQVNGNSMEPSLKDGELLIVSKFFNYKKGDIIAFYYNDKVLIKRVIALEGDTVFMDDDGTIYVNNKKLKEKYVKKLDYGKCNLKFPYVVPNDSVFILGDNREVSVDSRNSSIGCINTENVIGKIKVRINPLKLY